MAVRIPTYERSVQLDAASHTIPRIPHGGDVGRSIEGVGNALMSVAAHWQAKQDSFDKMQMGQSVNIMRQQIQQIIYEESSKFDPGHDRPGTLHDRIVARTNQAVQQFESSAPAHLAREYAAHGMTTSVEASNTAAHQESQQRNEYGKKLLDGVSAQIAGSVERNPDSGFQGVAQMKKAISDYTAAAGFTPAQARTFEEGYLRQIGSSAAKGFAQQGRTEDGKAFTDQFVRDRNAENPQPQIAPGQPQVAPDQRSENDGGALNANRIAEIDKNPTSKAAIEKAAAATGLDPNMLKVFASIESSGNPNAASPGGKYKGLFQLGQAEFGMNNGGGGNINNADDNAMAAAKLLVQRRDEMTKSLGREPTPSELYAGHQQGLGGAVAHISNPDQPAWQSMLATGEGKQIAAKQGPAAAETWAKSAIAGNVPKDVTNRLFNGDPNTMTSKEFMAYQSTRVRGGDVDTAVNNARIQPSQEPQRTVVASADGTVINDGRPPAYVGGMNVGGAGAPPLTTTPAGGGLVSEATAGKIRSQPIAADLKGSLNYAAGRNGVRVEVVSGGQDPHGQEGVTRTGSHRHDDGGAADVVLYDQKDGHKLDMTDEADRARMGSFITDAVRTGVTGVGASPNYMGNNTMHLGGGSAATWGAKGEETPAWVQLAHSNGRDSMLLPEAAAAAKALPTQTAQPDGAGAAPVQVAQAGGTPVMPGSRWDQWGVTTNNTLDGSQMKNAAIAKSMTVSLAGRVKADVTSTQLNGTGITLPKELQTYYKTPSGELTYDMIANKLGTGAAIQWQQDKDFAQKVYNGGAHMEDMPRGVILQRLQDLNPDPTNPYFDDQVKVYNEVLKKAKTIDDQRNRDPAGYADKDPAVAALLDAANKDPANQEKIQALVTARMNRQEQIGIPETLRTPISVAQAQVLAAPLLDRARPDRTSAPAEVADNIVKTIGAASVPGYDDLAHRALQTVLQTKKISDDQAAQTADALVQAQHPPPAPLVTTKVKPQNYDLSFMAKNGYYVGTSEGMDPYRGAQPSDNYADPPDQGFAPGTRFVPSDHITKLKQDPTLSDLFDNGDGDKFPGYGAGAAAYFLKGGQNSYSAPSRTASGPPSDALTAPVGAQPDQSIAPEQAPDQQQPDTYEENP